VRLIPEKPSAKATRSETDVFYLLGQTDFGDDATAFASVNLSAHEYKKWSEIDFVVISSGALIVIEVKGGQVSLTDNGIWRYTSARHGAVERLESPVAQASSAYFALCGSFLAPSIGQGAFVRVPSGFCVIFANSPPSTVKPLLGGTEMPPEIIGCREDVASPDALRRFLDRVVDYWRGRPPYPRGVWDSGQVRTLCQTIRPCFDRVAPLSASADRVRQDQLELTQEQYAVLDYLSLEPRMTCIGGAGCGKTLLSIESLRREIGNDPILIIGTPVLAEHLRHIVPAYADRISSFAELVRLPMAERGRYGCLIVDEGQQLTNGTGFEHLSSILDGGLEGGRWRWFSDPNNQVLGEGNFDPACHKWLCERSAMAALTKNCRNTPQIIAGVGLLTGADVGVAKSSGGGPDIVVMNETTREARAASAAAKINEWLRDPEIHPGHITLVTATDVEGSVIPLIAELARVPYQRWSPGRDQKPDYKRRMAVATVDEFRGLESPFIVLCDLSVDMTELNRLMYIGLTRANFAVAIVAEPECFTWLLDQRQRQLQGVR
jgi:hypothetical protein